MTPRPLPRTRTPIRQPLGQRRRNHSRRDRRRHTRVPLPQPRLPHRPLRLRGLVRHRTTLLRGHRTQEAGLFPGRGLCHTAHAAAEGLNPALLDASRPTSPASHEPTLTRAHPHDYPCAYPQNLTDATARFSPETMREIGR